METILLASSSARRRELLESIGIPFVVKNPDVDETLRNTLPPPDRVVVLAEDKARAAAKTNYDTAPRLILAADTLVCLPTGRDAELVMGKPEDEGDARRMIEALAGRAHFVHTGIALFDHHSGSIWTARSDSLVQFGPMSADEIEIYLLRGEWKDVAGAYRIQGAAALYIDRIEGSWSGIVGLPLRELYVILEKAAYRYTAPGRASF